MSSISGVLFERFHHKEANFSRSQAAETGDICIQEEFEICTAAWWTLKDMHGSLPFCVIPCLGTNWECSRGEDVWMGNQVLFRNKIGAVLFKPQPLEIFWRGRRDSNSRPLA